MKDIVQQYLSHTTDEIPEKQATFVMGRRNREQILKIRKVVEKSRNST